MINLDKLKELALKKLEEAELINAEKLPQQNIDLADRFLNAINDNDKRKISEFPNYDFLFMIICFFNNHEFTFDEIKRDVEKVKLVANSWGVSSRESFKILYQLYSGNNINEANQIKINQELEKLGLSELADKYNLGMTLTFMFLFMNYKYLANNVLNPDGQHMIQPSIKTKTIDYKSLMTPQQKQKKLEEDIKKSGLIEIVSFVKEYRQELISKHAYRQEVSAQTINLTKELIEAIETGEINQIGLIHTDWIKYLDPELLNSLFEIVFHNLLSTYKQKQEQNKRLQNAINKNQVSEFFYNHKINPNSLSNECLEHLEKLEQEGFCIIETLNFLNSLNINLVDFLESHYHYLNVLNHEKISFLSFLLNNKYISLNTLSSNISQIKNGFLQIITNYEILKPIIDVNNSYYDDSLLLKTTEVLRRMIEIIAEYDLTRNNYMFLLCNFEYLNIYDLLLENDIPSYLFISICETDNPLLTIKRILIYKAIGENYKTNTMLLKKDVKEENKFICRDEDLDSFIIGELRSGFDSFYGKSLKEINDSKIVRYFDKKFKSTYYENVYDFNGILISRPKFIRQLSACQNLSFESIINSLISNSILSDEECDTIKSLSNSYSKKLS